MSGDPAVAPVTTTDRTLLVIAHRLETIRSADQIVVLDATGHVAEVGPHP